MRTDTQGRIIWYWCDPEKNGECRKSSCSHLMTAQEGGICEITSRAEYARVDAQGNPIEYDFKTRRKKGCTGN